MWCVRVLVQSVCTGYVHVCRVGNTAKNSKSNGFCMERRVLIGPVVISECAKKKKKKKREKSNLPILSRQSDMCNCFLIWGVRPFQCFGFI